MQEKLAGSKANIWSKNVNILCHVGSCFFVRALFRRRKKNVFFFRYFSALRASIQWMRHFNFLAAAIPVNLISCLKLTEFFGHFLFRLVVVSNSMRASVFLSVIRCRFSHWIFCCFCIIKLCVCVFFVVVHILMHFKMKLKFAKLVVECFVYIFRTIKECKLRETSFE